MREFCTKWWKRIATVDMLFIGVLTLLASLFASWLKQFPGFSLFGALIIALLIGMIIQFPIRSAYVGSNDGRKAGVKDAAGLISNKLLRLGIILLGFKLNLQVLFTQGIKCLPIAAVVVTLTIIVCYAIARKLGVDPMLAILTAGGTGICGAAAVMGLAGSIKVPEDKQDEKDNDVTMAVAISIFSGRKIGLRERWVMQESISAPQVGGIVRRTRFILAVTLVLEGTGTLLLALRFCPEMGLFRGLWYAVFHAVSSFCNAGFDLMGAAGTPFVSLTGYAGDPLVNFLSLIHI